MRKEIAQAWYEALKSGEYEQGTTLLHGKDHISNREPGWCCLGVLLDVCIKRGFVQGHWEEEGSYYMYRDSNNNISSTDLSLRTKMEIGFTNPSHGDINLLEEDGAEITAIFLNDTRLTDFPSIAEYVKRTFIDV